MRFPIKKIINKCVAIKDNILSNKKYKLSYVVEGKDWAISYVGRAIVDGLKKIKFENVRVTTTALGIKNQIVHFGSLHTCVTAKGFKKIHPSNKIVLTWLHFVSAYNGNKNVLLNQKRIKIIHVPCNITKQRVLDFGIDPSKIVMIPLGVDLNLFHPAIAGEKEKIRDALGIPKDAFVIGSFQKDGVGWGEGMAPKMVKGPDVFIKAVSKLSKIHPVFVLLVGPARGYVKQGLSENGVKFKSVGYVEDFKEVANFYHALDLYLVTSRAEGGPQAVLEAMASGVPLVSTKVGVAPDIITNGENGFLAEIEDVGQIVQNAKLIIESHSLQQKLIESSLSKVKDYSWEKINQRYLNEIYLKI